MQRLVLTSLLLAIGSLAAWAEGGPENPAQFAEHKQKKIAHIETNIQELKALKACVSDAQSHADMQRCHDEKMARHKTSKEQHKGERKAELDQRIKKLQDEKARIDQPK